MAMENHVMRTINMTGYNWFSKLWWDKYQQ